LAFCPKTLKIIIFRKDLGSMAHYIKNAVSEIITAKQSNPTADTSVLEAEIDRMVYGMTDKKIKIIKGAI